MTGREHVSIGVTTTALALGAFQMANGAVDIVQMLPALGAVAVGSLAPDLDHPFSLASMSIPAGLISASLTFLVTRAYESAHPDGMFKIASLLGPVWSLAAWVCLGIGLTLVLASFVCTRMFGHRGIVHSLAFGLGASVLVLAGLALFRAPLWLALPFMWGWAAHLLADATTPAGLSHILWPYERQSI